MRAVMCNRFGPPESLVVEEVASPRPSSGQVVVSIKAAGVNFPDSLIIEGKYQIRPEPPFSPGFEVAGIVKEVAPDVADFVAGDRVMAITTWGGYAEEVAVDVANLIRMPDAMDFAPASAFMTTYGTAYYALKDRGGLQPGETLLVLGAAGGVGTAAIQLGKALGARVIAVASGSDKLAICKQQGADEAIDSSDDDFRARVKSIVGKQGIDVVIDMVGGPLTELAIRDMAWNGRFLVIGFASGEIPKLPLNLVLLKNCAVVGVFWLTFTKREVARSERNNDELTKLFLSGRVAPLLHGTYPLEWAPEALAEVLSRRSNGKVVLIP